MIKPKMKLTTFKPDHHMGTVEAIIQINFLPLPFSSPHINNFFAGAPTLLNKLRITSRTHIIFSSFFLK